MVRHSSATGKPAPLAESTDDLELLGYAHAGLAAVLAARGDADRAAAEVLRVPDVRRVEFGWGLSVVGEIAGTVSLVVYAYGEGGAPLVAAYGVVRTVAGASVGLFVASVGDRLRRDRLLRWLTGLKAVLLASAALVASQVDHRWESSRSPRPARRSRAPIDRCRRRSCPG